MTQTRPLVHYWMRVSYDRRAVSEAENRKNTNGAYILRRPSAGPDYRTEGGGESRVSLFPIHGKPASHAPGNCILNFLSTETASRPKIKYHYVQFLVPAAYARQREQYRNLIVPEDKGLFQDACRRVISTRSFSSFPLLKALPTRRAHRCSSHSTLHPSHPLGYWDTASVSVKSV